MWKTRLQSGSSLLIEKGVFLIASQAPDEVKRLIAGRAQARWVMDVVMMAPLPA